ncbi:MAG: 6-carboxytetrahydropterin synthase [Bacteroidota bacterium]|nr:6-carboxytetrahydropterin synthase [Bacteroidota bacterium]
MLQITKIFHFEMAHAIYGYEGPCKHIHGHSYELHVTVSSCKPVSGFLPDPGFEVDFADIKRWVTECVINRLDHALVLSASFQRANPGPWHHEKLVTWPAEPSAENLLLFMVDALNGHLPAGTHLARLLLYETKNSYAEWLNDDTFNRAGFPASG